MIRPIEFLSGLIELRFNLYEEYLYLKKVKVYVEMETNKDRHKNVW